MVVLPASSLRQFEAFKCYNSPYAAHDDGSAIDLYPGTNRAPSPAAGEVVAVYRVRAPWQPYTREFDYVIGIDTAAGEEPLVDTATGAPSVARILHVDPVVSVGDRVAVGDPLGVPVRAGFFAPWVANHLHVGFRRAGADLRRAGGSLPLDLEAGVTPYRWDGTGTVVRTGRTFVELAADLDPAAREADWVGVATDDGRVLDGGFPHYPYGGLIDRLTGGTDSVGTHEVSLLGSRVGEAVGRTVHWADTEVVANDTTVTGLSLFCARPAAFCVKLVCPDHNFAMGDDLGVTIRPIS